MLKSLQHAVSTDSEMSIGSKVSAQISDDNERVCNGPRVTQTELRRDRLLEGPKRKKAGQHGGPKLLIKK